MPDRYPQIEKSALKHRCVRVRVRRRVILAAICSASTKLLGTWSWALNVSGRHVFTSPALFPEFMQTSNTVKITDLSCSAATLELRSKAHISEVLCKEEEETFR